MKKQNKTHSICYIKMHYLKQYTYKYFDCALKMYCYKTYLLKRHTDCFIVIDDKTVISIRIAFALSRNLQNHQNVLWKWNVLNNSHIMTPICYTSRAHCWIQYRWMDVSAQHTKRQQPLPPHFVHHADIWHWYLMTCESDSTINYLSTESPSLPSAWLQLTCCCKITIKWNLWLFLTL